MNQSLILTILLILLVCLLTLAMILKILLSHERQKEARKEKLHKLIGQPKTLFEVYDKISDDLSVLDRLNRNVQKEKAEWFRKSTTKSQGA